MAPVIDIIVCDFVITGACQERIEEKRMQDAGSVTHAAMLETVELVVINGLSVRKVAREKGLSKSVVAR